MIDEALMSFEEKCAYRLRAIYRRYGYLPYEMGKFEEYELYIRNKDFLVSDRVIAFNDTNGKMMALKPDVTLSIIKSGEDCPGVKQKVCYSENVFRVSEITHRFREIMQTGLECIGDIDIYDIYEVLSLAAESLAVSAEDFCIEISNLDLVGAVIGSACSDAGFAEKAIDCIAEKNSHDLKRICADYGVDQAGYEKIASLISVCGDRNAVLEALRSRFDTPVLAQLSALSSLLDASPYADKIRFDFSVVNDRSYYNGFVFKGFVSGVCRSVLAGGQYDNMMKKMNRRSRAVGFAVYLDRLEDLFRSNEKYDVDCLLLYDASTDVGKLAAAVRERTAAGACVSAQKSIPEKLRYRELIDMRTEGQKC